MPKARSRKAPQADTHRRGSAGMLSVVNVNGLCTPQATRSKSWDKELSSGGGEGIAVPGTPRFQATAEPSDALLR